MPLGTKVDLGPGHIVLGGDPAPPPRKGHSSLPSFRTMSVVVATQSPMSATAEHLAGRQKNIPGNASLRSYWCF